MDNGINNEVQKQEEIVNNDIISFDTEVVTEFKSNKKENKNKKIIVTIIAAIIILYAGFYTLYYVFIVPDVIEQNNMSIYEKIDYISNI